MKWILNMHTKKMNKSRIIKDYQRDGYFKYSKSVNDTKLTARTEQSARRVRESIFSCFFSEGDITGSIQVLERSLSGTNTGGKA